MKAWIFKTFFAKEKLDILEHASRIGSMDAFKKAHADITETMADDLEKRSEELAKTKLQDLLSPIDWKSILTLNKSAGILFIGGEKVDAGRLANLKSEAEFLLASDLWQILYESPKELAHKAMFVSGETLVDLQKGRSMIFALQAQKNILDLLKSLK